MYCKKINLFRMKYHKYGALVGTTSLHITFSSPPPPPHTHPCMHAQTHLKCKGASTLCRAAECNKMWPCRVANGENTVDVNAV